MEEQVIQLIVKDNKNGGQSNENDGRNWPEFMIIYSYSSEFGLKSCMNTDQLLHIWQNVSGGLRVLQRQDGGEQRSGCMGQWDQTSVTSSKLAPELNLRAGHIGQIMPIPTLGARPCS